MNSIQCFKTLNLTKTKNASKQASDYETFSFNNKILLRRLQTKNNNIQAISNEISAQKSLQENYVVPESIDMSRFSEALYDDCSLKQEYDNNIQIFQHPTIKLSNEHLKANFKNSKKNSRITTQIELYKKYLNRFKVVQILQLIFYFMFKFCIKLCFYQ